MFSTCVCINVHNYRMKFHTLDPTTLEFSCFFVICFYVSLVCLYQIPENCITSSRQHIIIILLNDDREKSAGIAPTKSLTIDKFSFNDAVSLRNAF